MPRGLLTVYPHSPLWGREVQGWRCLWPGRGCWGPSHSGTSEGSSGQWGSTCNTSLGGQTPDTG